MAVLPEAASIALVEHFGYVDVRTISASMTHPMTIPAIAREILKNLLAVSAGCDESASDMNEMPSRATAINIQCIQHGEVLSVASATLCARDSVVGCLEC